MEKPLTVIRLLEQLMRHPNDDAEVRVVVVGNGMSAALKIKSIETGIESFVLKVESPQ